MARAALAAASALLLAAAGCGDEGIAEGATVTVYASAPLCGEAKRELAGDGDRVGDVRVQVLCLESAEEGGRLDLAAIGANARRAVEDSRTVAYVGEPSRAATRFSATILAEADIAQLANRPGRPAMAEVLRAIRRAGDSGSLRESLYDELG